MRWTGRSLMTHEDQWALVSQRFVSRFSRVEQLTADVTHVRHHLSLNERSVPFRSFPFRQLPRHQSLSEAPHWRLLDAAFRRTKLMSCAACLRLPKRELSPNEANAEARHSRRCDGNESSRVEPRGGEIAAEESGREGRCRVSAWRRPQRRAGRGGRLSVPSARGTISARL